MWRRHPPVVGATVWLGNYPGNKQSNINNVFSKPRRVFSPCTSPSRPDLGGSNRQLWMAGSSGTARGNFASILQTITLIITWILQKWPKWRLWTNWAVDLQFITRVERCTFIKITCRIIPWKGQLWVCFHILATFRKVTLSPAAFVWFYRSRFSWILHCHGHTNKAEDRSRRHTSHELPNFSSPADGHLYGEAPGDLISREEWKETPPAGQVVLAAAPP